MKYIKLFEDIIDWSEDWEEEDEYNDEIYKDYPENFKEFLIKNDAIESYHKNMLKYGYMKASRNGDLKEFFFFEPYRLWISHAFNWGKSPENYWESLSDRWESELKFL